MAYDTELADRTRELLAEIVAQALEPVREQATARRDVGDLLTIRVDLD